MGRIAGYIQLTLSSALLFLLILSDFGLLLPSDNTFARVLLHLSAILLIISSLLQLAAKKRG